MNELIKALDETLTDLAFTAPVSMDDLVQLRDVLREVLPAGTKIEVNCPKQTEVYVVADSIKRTVKVA